MVWEAELAPYAVGAGRANTFALTRTDATRLHHLDAEGQPLAEPIVLDALDIAWSVTSTLLHLHVESEGTLLLVGDIDQHGRRQLHIERRSQQGELMLSITAEQGSPLSSRLLEDGGLVVAGASFVGELDGAAWQGHEVPLPYENPEALDVAVGPHSFVRWSSGRVRLASGTSTAHQQLEIFDLQGVLLAASDSVVGPCHTAVDDGDLAYLACEGGSGTAWLRGFDATGTEAWITESRESADDQDSLALLTVSNGLVHAVRYGGISTLHHYALQGRLLSYSVGGFTSLAKLVRAGANELFLVEGGRLRRMRVLQI